jgi:hypothetical protein
MQETSANEANFDELGRNIERLGVRLRKLHKGSDEYTQSLQDLEDYYERTVQLRQYSIDTLREELKDAFARHSKFRNAVFLVLFVILSTGGAVIYLQKHLY